jgi:hypothetical protein
MAWNHGVESTTIKPYRAMAWNHGVEAAHALHVGSDDVNSGITKCNTEEVCDLVNGSF